MIFAGSLGAAGGGSPIKAIQRDLAQIGTGVQITGRLDAATVQAINQVLGGWDDAPPRLRTGNLSMHDVAANIVLVRRTLHAAVSGAQAIAAG